MLRDYITFTLYFGERMF